ncbi:hypothetical protein [Streptococcus massiliensis]|uniref:Membrane protein n=1 Tax=Streptococcus massiliensis TaxID=313439 RepID=A0A380KYL2_9STRE|nr:hypothetical protein [Streptococcus massiliensis]SUN77073.1 membrane protein [Streptococcus massiliensis]
MYHITLKSPSLSDDGFCQEITLNPYWSWTTFFFSFFVPIFRKDWKWAAIFLTIAWIFNWSIYQFDLPRWTELLHMTAFALIYNHIWMRQALREGWHAIDKRDQERLEHLHV